jgi:hypothetical protein
MVYCTGRTESPNGMVPRALTRIVLQYSHGSPLSGNVGPLELIFGREVRAPLKEAWTAQPTSVVTYKTEVQDKLNLRLKLALSMR